MKNKFNRFLALALNAALIAGMTACGSTTEVEENKTSKTPVSTVESSVNEGESSAAEEVDKTPVTLTWMLNNHPISGVLTDEYPVLQYIYEQTGIEIEWIPCDQDMMTLRASGGDLPDIVQLQWNMGPELVESGQALPLDDLLEKYGQNVTARMGDGLELSRKVLGNGEHIYSIPCGVARSTEDTLLPGGGAGFHFRADIYEAIGAPEMNSTDDLLNVLAQMQEYQREATGRDDIYGTIIKATSGAGANTSIWTTHYGYGYYGFGSAVDLETGELKHMLSDPDSPQWEGMEFWSKAYRMGILHPDSFTSNNPYALVDTGDALSSIRWNPDLLDKEIHGENAVLLFPDGVFEYYEVVYGVDNPLGSGAADNATIITTNCEYPERAMQLIDFLNSDEGLRAIWNGVQGVHWDYVDGEPVYIGEIKEAYEKSRADGDAALTEAQLPNAYALANAGEYTIMSDGSPAQISNSKAFLQTYTDPAYVAYASKYNEDFTFPGEVYDMWIKEGKLKSANSGKASVIYSLRGSLSIEDEQKYNAANEIFKQNQAALLTAESDEAFEKIKLDVIDQFMAVGLGDVDKALAELHAEAMVEAEALLGN